MVLAKLLGPPSRLSGDSSALLARTRERLLEKLDRLEAGPAAFWSAVLLGRRDGLSDRDRAAFARTGTAHLLAISGLHLGLVASWLFVLLRLLFGLGRRFAERVPPARSAALLTLPIVWCYALLSGLQPSTLRAALMISLYLGALLLGRRPSGVQSLSFAVITSLVSEPLLVQSVAFQLSVVAVAALLYGASNANRERRGVGSMGDGGGWARWRRVAMTSLRASSAASLGTLPIAWFTFYRLTPVAPLDNLLAIPMVSLLLMPLGMLWLLVALLPFGLERYLTTPMNLGSDALNALIRGLDRLPLSWPTRAPSLASLVALSVSCLAAIALLRGTSTTPRRLRLVVALGLLTTTAVHCWPTLESLVRPRLRVTALAVGQGDALLVEFPDGRTMLIDGGGAYRRASDPGRRVILPFLRYRGIRRIDILVLSHRDWDHLGGLFAVAENLPVGELWFNGRNTTSPGLRRFLRLLRARGVAIKVMLPDSATGSGTRRSREIAGVKVQLLQPREGDQLSGPNSLSLTLRLVFGRVSFLFPGDIERDGEELLLARHPTLRASVLKVPHHGSNTSSHRRFLEQIKPRIALFCVGRGNRFGFPRPEIWRRYGRIGARRMRTDRDGAIVVTTDGERIKLDWFRRDRVVRYPALWNPNAERSDHGH
ncbi:MAG: DNA internalization-related competence protein ComEC/Rec2 [Myxococcales bacterium]|nr:DNA internalization-related competence protein ComEC/Rec2 [Myxococcales bacterium]